MNGINFSLPTLERGVNTMSTPYLHDINGKKIFMVNGKPFIMLAGEVHNSSSSSAEYMEGVWEKAKTIGLNSLLLPVTWEMTEPQEGFYDFDLVDKLIEQARKHHKKLAFLWFGAWKNAQCMYAPSWIKTDLKRFKRAQVEKGKDVAFLERYRGLQYTTLSYLCQETLSAESKAFSALMEHIKLVDSNDGTVIAIQVENETGLQGAAREHSDKADLLFAQAVPQNFVDYMKNNTAEMSEDVLAAIQNGKNSGTWSEVFGRVAEEIFSAYYVSSYVNTVAKAGKAVYALPMFANCWLNQGGSAGDYPSGGPVARVMEVWRYCAPAIDIIAPDIYIREFCDTCDEYTKLNNPLFIPETATHSLAGSRLVYTVGHYHGIGFAPFGFETMGEPFTVIEGFLFGMDTSDPALSKPQNVEEYGWYNSTLNSMMELLTEKYGTRDLQAVLYERNQENTLIFGTFGFKVMMDQIPIVTRKDGVCLVLKQAEDEFYIIACGCMIMPFSANPEKPYTDILNMEDGEFINRVWTMHRRLNGDEVAVKNYEKPILLKVKLFAYN
ncbi:MAG: DUF5597 domain-containing protein [Dysgonomonas sp.]